jgi:tetratricopeptide (TPR) repeat protein
MSAETINALASLWKLALVIMMAFGMYLFRKPLEKILEGLVDITFKHGSTEVAIRSNKNRSVAQPDETSGGPSALQEEQPPADPRPPSTVEVGPSAEVRYFTALAARDAKTLDSAFEEIQKSEQDAEVRMNNEAMHFFYLYSRLGDESALGRLRLMAQREEATVNTKMCLAIAYEKAGDHLRAAEMHEQSAAVCSTEEERAVCMSKMAESLYESGRKAEAFSRLSAELAKTKTREAESHLYEGVGILYGKDGETVLRALAFERALEARPNNSSLRFQAAYDFSQESFTSLAFVHYRKQIEFHQDDAVSLNNLGVACDRLKLPSQAVRHYRAAAQRGETLAMANLAYLFMNAGFLAEAGEILDKARTMEKVHANVGEALAASSRIWEAETKKAEKCIEKARQHQDFFSKFAIAAFIAPKKREACGFPGRWKMPSGTEFELIQEGDAVTAEWHIGEETHYLKGKAVNRAFKGVIGYKNKLFYPNKEKRIFGYIGAVPGSVHLLTTGCEDDSHELIVCSILPNSDTMEDRSDESKALAPPAPAKT